MKNDVMLMPAGDCPPAKRRLMTAIEAASLLNMDDRTLIRWARTGYAPAHPLGEGRRRIWRFFEDDLLAWVASQSHGRGLGFRSAA